MAERMEFFTPRGRWVHGSITEKRAKDMDGRPIDPEKQQYEFGVAIPKTDPALGDLFARIAGHAKAGYANQPAVVSRIDQWFQTMSGFSMKISDGDKPNARGSINQNTQGHFVFYFATGLDITTCGPDNVSIDPGAIQRGDYVDIAGSIAINGLTDRNAGIYMNGSIMRLLDYGEPIVGSADPNAAFGAAAGAALGARPGAAASGVPGGGVHGAAGGAAVPGGAPATGGAVPGGNPTPPAADPAATAAAALPGQAATQPPAGAGTASPGEAVVPGGAPATGHPAHPGILPGQG